MSLKTQIKNYTRKHEINDDELYDRKKHKPFAPYDALFADRYRNIFERRLAESNEGIRIPDDGSIPYGYKYVVEGSSFRGRVFTNRDDADKFAQLAKKVESDVEVREL